MVVAVGNHADSVLPKIHAQPRADPRPRLDERRLCEVVFQGNSAYTRRVTVNRQQSHSQQQFVVQGLRIGRRQRIVVGAWQGRELAQLVAA